MIGLLVIGLAIATALLAAASMRLASLVSSLLAAYLGFSANLVVVVVALSPFREVTLGGLAVAEAILFAGVLAGWWLRGRPGLPLGAFGPAIRAVAGEPVAAIFLAVAILVLGYELVLVLTVPPNNWDALTYHLARVAWWVQFHGIHWIPNAPSDRLNEFQPVAEQELLFLFVATGKGALFAVPQYVAELAILVSVYGAARRLGFDPRLAACSAFLLATFSLVALQATTAQNDLVAASFPAAATCLALGNRRAEMALAGLAAGIGLGVKLTTLLVWPVLVLLLWKRGRPAAVVAATGAAAGFVAVGMWGYVLNLLHTGHLLGYGASRVKITAQPSFPGSFRTAIHVVYRTLDLSVLSNALIYSLAAAGVVLGVAVGTQRYRQAGPRRGLLKGTCVAAPLLAPVAVIAAGAVIAFLTRIAHIPVHDASFFGGLNRTANEDYAAFGPVGAVFLLAVPVLTVVSYRARKVDVRHLALALALPVFLVLLVLQAKYNAFLTRFLLVPAALTAPLFARFFRGRVASATLVAVASLGVGLTLADNRMKPLHSPYGRPWQLTQAQAVELNWQPGAGRALDPYRKLVPSHACVGAVVGPDEPSYLLYGPRFEHRVAYLPSIGALAAANNKTLFYVVISGGVDRAAVNDFRKAGWRIKPLADYWLLAVSPASGALTGACSA
jgi:glycosyl transferase family 87